MGRANEFKIIIKETTGNIYVRENTQYNNIQAENVTVFENVIVRLFGVVKGLLTLKAGSSVYLHGSLYGSVKNEGGEIHIFNKEDE